MRTSIRTRFTLGMIFFFVIIAGISILSAYHLNKLSQKTDAILKDNHLSVIVARDMAEALTVINQEITNCFVNQKELNFKLINSTLSTFKKSLLLEKNNITERGEDKLVSAIELGFDEYQKSATENRNNQVTKEAINILISKYLTLYQQTMLLSQMNEQAIVMKADETKKSAKKGLTNVSIFGTVCFLITLSFTYNFASYFNERFTRLYNGIKEIGSSNYTARLNFEGEDEFYDISLVFNEMAKNLNEKPLQSSGLTNEDEDPEMRISQTKELKWILEQMKEIKERAFELIAKLENEV